MLTSTFPVFFNNTGKVLSNIYALKSTIAPWYFSQGSRGQWGALSEEIADATADKLYL